MRVSVLTAADVVAYRALMLEAYECAPDAFTTTAAEREAEPASWWIERIGSAAGSATSFGAWEGGCLVGTVALQYSAKPKTRHAALVLGMYVRPQARGKSVGLALLNAAIAAAGARPEVLSLTLTLTEGNAPALRLYRSVGFVEWGTQPQAIRTDSGLKGKVHLSLVLPRPDAARRAMPTRLTLEDVRRRLPLPATAAWPDGVWDVLAFARGTMSVVYFAPRGRDHQTSHAQDELYVVLSGSGVFVAGDERVAFGPGDVLFVPANVRHRFEDFDDDLATWAIFWGPTGGEVPADAPSSP